MFEVYRKLGLHDRYSLARCNIGYTPVIAVVSTLNLLNVDETVEARVSKVHSLLSSRISRLLKIVPMLSFYVTDTKTNEPKWCRSDREVTSEHILKTNQLGNSDFGLEKVMLRQWKLGMDSLKVDREPLWRVDIHYETNSNTIYIGLSVNHTLIDGKGCFNLYRLLVSPQFDLSKDLPQSDIDIIRGSKFIPDASDVSYVMKPGLDIMVPVVFRTYVLPYFPSFLRRYFEEKAYWPYQLGREIKQCEPKTILLQFKEKGFVKDLKEVCKRVGNLKTIHTPIASCIMIGILSLALTEEKDRVVADGGRPKGTKEKINIKCDNPINIRKPDTGLTVGNYVSGFVWNGELDGDSSFWDFTKVHDEAQNSKAGRETALAYLGLLGYIADGGSAEPTETEPTGWERYFNNKKSFGGSFSLSNLGAMPSLLLADPSAVDLDPIPIEEIAWCQTPSVVSNALSFDLCGLSEDEIGERGGLSIAIGFRDGTLSEAAVRKLSGVVERTLKDLARGKIEKETKVKDLIY